jgi:hypothetical protein
MVPSFSKMPSATMNRLVSGPTFPSFLFDAEGHLFQTFEVIMIEPANGTTRNLQALLDSETDAPVGDNHVATFCECKDYTRYSGQPLGVENEDCAEEVCYLALNVQDYKQTSEKQNRS